VCDGTGGVTSANDDTDLPVDGNVCTKDVCTSGTPSNPALPPGTLCAADGSKTCDGATTPACNALTFRVVRVGPGSPTPALSNASTPVFIEERRANGSLVGTALPMPTAASGNNQALTMSGSAGSEGCLSLSADGHLLALAGYAAAPGMTGIKSTTVNRVAGLIDVTGAINTATVFSTGDNGDNVRAATTVDGVDVWISGAGSPNANGGIWYNQQGMTAGETHVVATPNTTRCLGVFGGQLYASASVTAPPTNVFKIGFGTPTGMNETTPSLPGMTGTSPNAFAMFDLVIVPSGIDTMYVADDGAGLQKWTYDGTNWTLAATFNVAGNTGFRGVAGYAVSGTVTLMASTAETAMNRLVVFVDDGVNPVTGNVVATAATNTIFRGVALSPHFPAP